MVIINSDYYLGKIQAKIQFFDAEVMSCLEEVANMPSSDQPKPLDISLNTRPALLFHYQMVLEGLEILHQDILFIKKAYSSIYILNFKNYMEMNSKISTLEDMVVDMIHLFLSVNKNKWLNVYTKNKFLEAYREFVKEFSKFLAFETEFGLDYFIEKSKSEGHR